MDKRNISFFTIVLDTENAAQWSGNMPLVLVKQVIDELVLQEVRKSAIEEFKREQGNAN